MATAIVEIEGIVRTHGLTYDSDNDIMVLTDVGAGSDDSDGAIHIIDNFLSKFSMAMNGMNRIVLADEVRIAGDNTFLGNPVDVALSEELGTIYVAERANGSGRVLTFAYPSNGGNIAPMMNIDFAGASAVYLEE